MAQPPNDIALREASLSDIDAIIEVENLSFVHAGERFSRRRVSGLIINARSTVTLAVADQKTLGWAAGLIWTHGPRPWGRIYAIAVHPDARGQRVGQRLLDDMIAALHRQGSGQIFLEVRKDNAAAVHLYESRGFVACRLLLNYYGPGIAGQRMELSAPKNVGNAGSVLG